MIKRRASGSLHIWVMYRTLQQWRRCTRIGRLLGLTQDRVLARSLRLGLLELQRQCDAKGIDWRVQDEEESPTGPSVNVDDAADARKPMITE